MSDCIYKRSICHMTDRSRHHDYYAESSYYARPRDWIVDINRVMLMEDREKSTKLNDFEGYEPMKGLTRHCKLVT